MGVTSQKQPTDDKVGHLVIGPTQVLERVGDQSYSILIKERKSILVHASQMKPYVEDLMRD